MSEFFPGCGVEVVAWLPPVRKRANRTVPDRVICFGGNTLFGNLTKVLALACVLESEGFAFRSSSLIRYGLSNMRAISGFGDKCEKKLRELLTPEEWEAFAAR